MNPNSAKIDDAKNTEFISNIKIAPLTEEFKSHTKKPYKPVYISRFYFLSWAILAGISVLTLSGIVINQGGVENTLKMAKFNKINRQIDESRFNLTVDNLPTASIIPLAQNRQTSVISPVTIAATPIEGFGFNISDDAKNSSKVISTTYFSAFLGRSDNKSNVLDLWYAIKQKTPELFEQQQAAYYFDEPNNNYNLIVGKFNDLTQTLQFCAELKFHDIYCKYDAKFTNLKITMID